MSLNLKDLCHSSKYIRAFNFVFQATNYKYFTARLVFRHYLIFKLLVKMNVTNEFVQVERVVSDAARIQSCELAVMSGLEICVTAQSEPGLWGQIDGFVGSLHKQHGMPKHKLVATPLKLGTAKDHHHN